MDFFIMVLAFERLVSKFLKTIRFRHEFLLHLKLPKVSDKSKFIFYSYLRSQQKTFSDFFRFLGCCIKNRKKVYSSQCKLIGSEKLHSPKHLAS